MKNIFTFFAAALVVIFLSTNKIESVVNGTKKTISEVKTIEENYKFPTFYKGIYLNSYSGRNFKKLSTFISNARKAHLNTVVIDFQDSKYRKSSIPEKNIKYCLENGFHPIARIVVFPNGLKHYPVSKEMLLKKIKLAEAACKIGFKEIQFDYIRFNDHNILRRLSLKEKYAFIEGFLLKARTYLKRYNVKIAADIFGRIPLNKRDTIGQRMEGLDKVVDVICPMAYPSHYTWSKKYQSDPYFTVYLTSKKARERTKNADIVTYIQAFKMKIGISKMSFKNYIKQQIKACHDSGIKGFLLWNARQVYTTSFNACKDYYGKKKI